MNKLITTIAMILFTAAVARAELSIYNYEHQQEMKRIDREIASGVDPLRAMNPKAKPCEASPQEMQACAKNDIETTKRNLGASNKDITVKIYAEALGDAFYSWRYLFYAFDDNIRKSGNGALTAYQKTFADRYPGSSINGRTRSGVIALGNGDESLFSDGKLIKHTVRSVGDSLIREFHYGNHVVKVSDTSGNYMTFNVVDKKIIDVRLPISASSSSATINRLNKFYAGLPDGKDLFGLANKLLLDNGYREMATMDIAIAPTAASADLSAQDAEIAKLKVELEAIKANQAAEEEKPVKKNKKKKQ